MFDYFKNFPFAYQDLDHLVGQDYRGALKNIRRFNSKNFMVYRTNLYDHIEIGKLMIQDIAKNYAVIELGEEKIKFNPNYQELLFQHHDDTEMLLSDVPSSIKRKMTYQEKDNLMSWENLAVNILSKNGSNTVEGHSYFQILNLNLEKSIGEVKINSVIDKKQAYRQALIEVKKGNFSFVEPILDYPKVINQTIDKFGLANYGHEFLRKEKDFILIKDMWEHVDKLFNDPGYFLDEIKEYLSVVDSYNPNIRLAKNELITKPIIEIKKIEL